MKQLTQLSILFLAFFITTSCQNNSNTDESALMATTIAETETNRNMKAQLVDANAQAIDRFSLADVKIDLSAMETVAMQQMNAEDADAAAIMSMNQALMSAEKEAQLLDVKFSMSDEPVENGVFIFGIESADAKNLTLEMFDEEGFAMVANNKFEINGGNNYKALNVESMNGGAYIFRLKDDAGKELVRTVNISATK